MSLVSAATVYQKQYDRKCNPWNIVTIRRNSICRSCYHIHAKDVEMTRSAMINNLTKFKTNVLEIVVDKDIKHTDMIITVIVHIVRKYH